MKRDGHDSAQGSKHSFVAVDDKADLYEGSSTSLTLPFPPKELSPNARGGWRRRARAAADYRYDCGMEAVVAYPKGRYTLITPPVQTAVTFVVPDRRRRDED